MTTIKDRLVLLARTKWPEMSYWTEKNDSGENKNFWSFNATIARLTIQTAVAFLEK